MYIWEKNATDEEIKNCSGDYIGCEICRNVGRCNEIVSEEVDAVIKEIITFGKEN